MSSFRTFEILERGRFGGEIISAVLRYARDPEHVSKYPCIIFVSALIFLHFLHRLFLSVNQNHIPRTTPSRCCTWLASVSPTRRTSPSRALKLSRRRRVSILRPTPAFFSWTRPLLYGSLASFPPPPLASGPYQPRTNANSQ